MVGSATFTIVPSSTSMNVMHRMANSAYPRCGALSPALFICIPLLLGLPVL